MSNLPEGWVETTLGEIASINPREPMKKGTIAKCVAMEKLPAFDKRITGFELKPFKGGTKFRNGDTLLARITPCLENGKTAYVDILDEGEVGFGSTEYIVIREKEDLSDKQFLFYLATSPRFREIAIKCMTGTSGRQRVQTDVLINRPLFLPPLPEQKAIADMLSSFDEKIELLREQNKTLETLAQTIFKEWFVHFNFPDQQGKPYKTNGGEMVESELGLIPQGWRVGMLSEIAEFLNGLALQKYPPIDGQETLPVIKTRELKQGVTAQTDKANTELDKKYIIDNGDVLFSWSGSLEVVLWKHGKGALNQHLFKVSSKDYPKWFYYYWTLHHLRWFRSIAADKATTMGHIQRKHLDEAKVLIPSGDIMEQGTALFAPMIEKIVVTNGQIQTLSKTRDTLLPKLMSGQVRVKF